MVFDWESIRFIESLGAASKQNKKTRSSGGSAWSARVYLRTINPWGGSFDSVGVGSFYVVQVKRPLGFQQIMSEMLWRTTMADGG